MQVSTNAPSRDVAIDPCVDLRAPRKQTADILTSYRSRPGVRHAKSQHLKEGKGEKQQQLPQRFTSGARRDVVHVRTILTLERSLGVPSGVTCLTSICCMMEHNPNGHNYFITL